MKIPMMTQFADILQIVQSYAVAQPMLIAIDGHSAAGKSALADRLAQLLPAVVIIHADDFYRPMDEADRAQLAPAGGYEWYYDWQRLEREVLIPLRAGQASHYRRYDWSTNTLAGWLAVQPEGIIVVEGCYTARPELRCYYDLIVLVETSAARRTTRQQARTWDTTVWVARWDAAECYYMEHIQPQTYADLRIAGE